MNLNSTKVHVFPFGSTRKINPTARIMNEQNIRGLITHITDKPSYVISYNKSSKVMEFVLNGYYFRVVLDTFLESHPGEFVTAYVAIAEDDDGYTYLYGEDTDGSVNGKELEPENTVFTGLYINQQPNIDGCKVYSLELLDAEENVPQQSKIKFSSDSIDVSQLTFSIEHIDCGTSTKVM